MSSSRLGDPSVTPYPPGIVQKRSLNGLPENSDHSRQSSRSRKPKPRARVDRSSRPEEERFNVGPIAPRNTGISRHSTRRQTRNGRQDRPALADLNDLVPNYPPPSFQEAIATPSMLMCASNLTLVSTPASPARTLIVPSSVSLIPHQSSATLGCQTPTDVHNTDPESDSDSDSSLQIIDSGSVPLLPSGTDLDARVREDWLHRRGVEFPGAPYSRPDDQGLSRARSRPEARGRRPTLDLAAILDAPDNPRIPATPSPKRRFMSLSPLRTIFPTRAHNSGDRPQTAHPTPGTSPYLQSHKGSTFFKSTTSLATASFLRLPLSGVSNNGKTEKRKLFSSKGREKSGDMESAEALEAWEELSVDDVQETPPSLLSVVESACNCVSPTIAASPTRSASFTYGAQAAEAYRFFQASISPSLPLEPQPKPQHQPPQQESPNSVHPLSLRDRKVPFVKRPVRRSKAPTPPRIQVPIPVPLEPVLTTVRTRLRQTTPPPPAQAFIPRNSVTAQVTRPSPLSLSALTPLIHEKETLDTSFWKAVRTPLPTTPVKAADVTYSPNPPILITLGSRDDDPAGMTAIPVRSPTPARPGTLEFGVSQRIGYTPPLIEQPPIFSRAPSPFVEEPVTPTRHHYPGRPLPRPPGSQPRIHVDSTFASSEEYEFSESSASSGLSTCPEGLLIDLTDSTTSESADSSPFATDLINLFPESETTIFEPLPLSATLEDLTFMPETSSIPPPSRAEPITADTNAYVYSEITDLDVLASQLADDEERQRDGTNYDVSGFPTPPSPVPNGRQERGGALGVGHVFTPEKVQTLNLSPNEGFAYCGRVYRASKHSHYIQPPPPRISWRKPNIISPDHGRGIDANLNSASSNIENGLPARTILDTHYRQQRQWQYLPARVY